MLVSVSGFWFCLQSSLIMLHVSYKFFSCVFIVPKNGLSIHHELNEVSKYFTLSIDVSLIRHLKIIQYCNLWARKISTDVDRTIFDARWNFFRQRSLSRTTLNRNWSRSSSRRRLVEIARACLPQNTKAPSLCNWWNIKRLHDLDIHRWFSGTWPMVAIRRSKETAVVFSKSLHGATSHQIFINEIFRTLVIGKNH